MGSFVNVRNLKCALKTFVCFGCLRSASDIIMSPARNKKEKIQEKNSNEMLVTKRKYKFFKLREENDTLP